MDYEARVTKMDYEARVTKLQQDPQALQQEKDTLKSDIQNKNDQLLELKSERGIREFQIRITKQGREAPGS